jgi:tetratricopeptide (TPR) repeat protein
MVHVMFDWFQPKCPVDADVKRWIERRTAWLIDQFGWPCLRGRATILPTAEYFPDPYDGSPEEVRRLLDRVCRYMDVDPGRVELEFYSESSVVAQDAGLPSMTAGSLGQYDEHCDTATIWLEASHLDDAASVVATLAHELGYVHLLGDRRVTPDTADHEPLSDLLAVVFGLGVCTANSLLHDVSHRAGHFEGWSVVRQGYLTAPTFGYALGLLSWLRGEERPDWAALLRGDVRTPLRQTLRYLAETGDTMLTRGDCPALRESLAEQAEPFAYPRGAVFKTHGNDLSRDGDALPPEDAMEPADVRFTQGVALAHYGDLRGAVEEFSAAIGLRPDDAECLQQRSLAYTQLGEYAAAVADAEEAVRLDPASNESYLIRGKALLGDGQYQRAIADLDHFTEAERNQTGAFRRLAEGCLCRGLAWAAQGEPARAIADFTAASQHCPTWPAVYLARARAYEQLGMIERARADRDEAARRGARIE